MGATYAIAPGASVGEFALGDTLWHVLDVLRTKKTEYPKVEVAWDPGNAVKSAITVTLPLISLYFPSSQILSVISIPSLNKNLTLSYDSHVLSSQSTPLTRGRVGQVLGPTYAGSSSSKLAYPGIEFDLEGSGSGSRDDLVKGLRIVDRDPAAPRNLSPLLSCVVNPGKGVTLSLWSGEEIEVVLGETTAQDLFLDLGNPLRTFIKEDDRMEKMWGSGSHSEAGDYFHNYFQYGLDFLLNTDNVVIKVLCHSNIPGTPLFQRYGRCPWVIRGPNGEADYTSSIQHLRSSLSKTADSPTYAKEPTLRVPIPSSIGSSKSNGKKGSKGSTGSTPSSRASTPAEKPVPTAKEPAKEAAKEPAEVDSGAMVLDRVGEGGMDGVLGMPQSKLIGLDGLVVEEDGQSGGIASVLVFEDRD